MLLIGLGNPGKKYEGTRHNIGFEIIEKIISKYDFPTPQKKFNALYAEGEIAKTKVKVLMPQTFMNLSGGSFAEAAKFFKIPLSEIFVFHDELDLPLGRLKTKVGGGDGGHNGLKSIDSLCGKNYNRVRVGIGHPGNKDMVSSYVLSKFNADESKFAEDICDVIVDNVNYLVKGDVQLFATRFAEQIVKFEPKKAE
jgi:PTH1 family peptidyl-tRNA hydrolase